MKFLANELKSRIQILRGLQDPGLFDIETTYESLVRLWASVKVRERNASIYTGDVIINGVNLAEIESHSFIVRYQSIINRTTRSLNDGFDSNGFPSRSSEGLGRAFTIGFSDGFDSIRDVNPIKSNFFIFLEDGQRNRGRLFRILRIVRDEVYKEWAEIKCILVDERGTGAKI